MEESAYNSLMLGVYTFIFITAISLTIYLFSSTVAFADKAYEYGKLTTGDSIIETTSAPKYNVVTGAELLTYYYNYKSPDKYGTTTAQNYDFTNINDIQINKLYTLLYKTANTGQNPVIEVKMVESEQLEMAAPYVGVNVSPTDPIIITYPTVVNRVTPGTSLDFKAQSTVTYSILTNYINSYIWRIDYSPEDGRADFTTTTTGATGELKSAILGDKLEFRKGTNTVFVTAEDRFGNRSNTMSKVIPVGYNDPIITSLVEINGKVANYGTIVVESPSGVSLNFQGNATSMNPLGYVQTYDWYSNEVLIQSGGSNTLSKSFAPGTYALKLIVHDSIEGTSTPETFNFTVGNIPPPTLTCSNNAVITAGTIGIDPATIALTFNASSQPQYGITRYVWTIDGAVHNTNVPNGLNLTYGIGSHTVSVYGVNSQGISSETKTISFTINQNFTAFNGDYATNGSYHTETLTPGKYIFEVWGAQGGNGSGGNGGYCKGQINLTTTRTVYIYVGSSAGYNGGGIGRLSYSTGGGATDIRLSAGSLASRIIVAGGGGGNGGNSTTSGLGGEAGGLTGSTGGTVCGAPGTGGTQTAGGVTPRLNTYGGTNGSFGIGGNGESVLPGVQSYHNSVGSTAGAGGGGYYGGGGASCDMPNWNDLDDSGGGGGSSFISGYTGCNAVNSSGVHTNQSNHYSGLVFTNMTMTAGNNAGNGKAKITKIP